MYYRCIISIWKKLLPRNIYIPRASGTMAVCWKIWYHSFCLVSSACFNCIVHHSSLYHNMNRRTMWRCASVSYIPSESKRLVYWWALFWWWMSLCFPFTSSLIWFYSILIVVISIGIMVIFFLFWTTRSSFLQPSSPGSANAHLPGYSTPGHPLWILDFPCYLRTPLCQG